MKSQIQTSSPSVGRSSLCSSPTTDSPSFAIIRSRPSNRPEKLHRRSGSRRNSLLGCRRALFPAVGWGHAGAGAVGGPHVVNKAVPDMPLAGAGEVPPLDFFDL